MKRDSCDVEKHAFAGNRYVLTYRYIPHKHVFAFRCYHEKEQGAFAYAMKLVGKTFVKSHDATTAIFTAKSFNLFNMMY
jgi:hypothetical protein